ncbi:MAG TPA: GAF domain-containing protein [Thermoplasmata archaeon]|nr:GAF domain-containing protein [Thermoplasmata archaeon]
MSVAPRRREPALLQVRAILGRLQGREALQEVCRYLRAEFSHYRWVGVYERDGSELRLAAWDGDRPTEHTTIPIDRGVCGRAVRENRSVVVPDVKADPDYLECFLETRSEIVVPVRVAGVAVGEIDIDGTEVGAYDRTDAVFLEAVGELIAPLVRGDPGSGRSELNVVRSS